MIKSHIKQVLGNLGVRDQRQVWSLTDFSRKVLYTFSHMKGLWRCHYYVSEALHLLLDGHILHGVAYLCQVLKAIHQAALDHGDWRTASLLVPTPDPLQRPTFGGTEVELADIHSYQRSITELQKKVNYQPEADGGQGGGGAKGEGKGGNNKERKPKWWSKKKDQSAEAEPP